MTLLPARVSILLVFATALSWFGVASAGPVLLVRSPKPSVEVAETLTRLQGELLSVGFVVEIVDRPAAEGPEGIDLRAWAEKATVEREARAVLDVTGDDAVVVVDVWVLKTPGRFEVTRVSAESNAATSPNRLAIRALEALRASLLEADFEARHLRAPPAPSSEVAALSDNDDRALPRARARLELDVGASLLTSLDGVGPELLPVVRAGWAARPWLVVQAEFTGPGTRSTLSTAEGDARVGQLYAVVGGCYRLGPEARWWPLVSLSVGALRTQVEGRARSGAEGHAVEQTSFLVDGGIGAGLRLSSPFYVTLAARVQWAEPNVAIHIFDAVRATIGRPNFLVPVTLGGRL